MNVTQVCKRALLLAGCCAVFAFGASGVMADEMHGEYRDRCTARDITVWGVERDFRLGREDVERIDVKRGQEMTWFCGNDRRTFYCRNSGSIDYLTVDWNRSGDIFFQCWER